MDSTKLFNAAKLIKTSHPTQSEELLKIAQDLQGFTPDNIQATEQPQEVQVEQANPDSANLNPNIKNFANPNIAEELDQHKITFTVDVARGMGELEIMNELLPVLKGLKNIKIKGYQFQKS